MKMLQKMIYQAVLTSIGLSLLITNSYAEIAVVTHRSTSVSSVSTNDAKKIFLGKKRSFKPVDQKNGSAVHKEFYQKVVKKNPSQLKSYWSKMIFSGKGTPPKEMGNDAAVKQWISSNPGSIGYIHGTAVDQSVKVLLRVR